MSQITVRLTDGRRLVAIRRAETLLLVVGGEPLGTIALPQAWRLSEGLDRLATAAPMDRRRVAPATRPTRQRAH